jgi:hypothetical protein
VLVSLRRKSQSERKLCPQRKMDVSAESALSRDVSTLSEIIEPPVDGRLSADESCGPSPPPAIGLSREPSADSGDGVQGAGVCHRVEPFGSV